MTTLFPDEARGRKPKLLEQVRTVRRAKYYSRCTEKAYLSWIRRFILVHDKRHPKEVGGREIARFSICGVCGEVSPAEAGTPNAQAAAAIRLPVGLSVDAARFQKARSPGFSRSLCREREWQRLGAAES